MITSYVFHLQGPVKQNLTLPVGDDWTMEEMQQAILWLFKSIRTKKDNNVNVEMDLKISLQVGTCLLNVSPIYFWLNSPPPL